MNISGIYRKFFCGHPAARQSRGSEAPASSREIMAQCSPLLPGAVSAAGSIMLNWAAAWRCWWGGSVRRIYRVNPATASELSRVGIGWLPEAPPASWEGRHLAYELASPMDGLLGAAGYYAADSSGRMTLYVLYLHDEGAYMMPLEVGACGALNRRLLESGELVSAGWEAPGIAADVLRLGWPALQLLLALSYYLLDGERMEVRESYGPAERLPGGAQETEEGRIVPTWRWADLALRGGHARHDSAGARIAGADGMLLQPVVVRSHVRRIGDKAVIIDPYGSHRWRADADGRSTGI